MSYINRPAITIADGPNADAFQRLRISTPTTLFDSKQLVDTGSYVWNTATVGNATASFYSNNASTILFASGSNSSVIRATRRHFIYQPGKSQLIICTANFSGSQSNVIKRIGYFDNDDGLYFVSSGSSFGVGVRSMTSGTPIDTFISQSSWNLDTYNGAGPSGNTLNISASQIYFIDFEWLGVGRVRWGIYQGGIPTYVHQLTNINTLPTVFMASPNQPVRYEIINSGSVPASLLHICSTVASEGGYQNLGSIKAISNVGTAGDGQTFSAGNYYGVIAIRLKSTSFDSLVIPVQIGSGQTTGNCIYEMSLLVNPSGSLPWVWQDLPNSTCQYATGSPSYLIATEGNKIFSTINAGISNNNVLNFDPTFGIGADIGETTSDVLVVGWRGISGNAQSSAATFVWQEQQ